MLQNKQKNRFYNPIKQNRTHIKWLGHYLESKVPLYSIVVFSERCELKKVTVDSSDIRVIKRDYLYAVVRDIWNKTEDQCSKDEVKQIYEKLEVLTHADKAQKEAHIENIKAKYKRAEKPEEPEKTEKKAVSGAPQIAQKEIEITQEEKVISTESAKEVADVHEKIGMPIESESAEKIETSLICPKCGGNLVLRTAKKGPNTGSSFYGCSNDPKCRYVKNID